ncbi:MAG: ABC transporter substrate-binding protein, partial [Desulfobulbales bacterium]
MKRRIAAVLLIGIIFLTCSCRQQEKQVPPSGMVVKIGVIAPMSGPDKQSGESALYGIRTALQLQPYLKNGDKVELVIVDNR